MKSHRELLPKVVELLTAVDEKMGIVIVGSVARGSERPDSDIDITVIFSGDEHPPLDESSFFSTDNRWALRTKGEIENKRIDLAWDTENNVLQRLRGPEPDKTALFAGDDEEAHFQRLEAIRAEGNGPAGCWPLATGWIIHDPLGIAEHCQSIAKTWFESNPDILEAIEKGYLAAKQKQYDR